jgi:hypothetical protein
VNNHTFRKSVRLLTHPLCLAAIGLMLANDFILKPLAPSWLTGKLSDFAGLFFLPFLLAALLALVVPGRLVGGVSFAVTAGGFALLKLDPAANAAALGLLNGLTGLTLRVMTDPGDLLALLSLVPAAWLWRRPSPVTRPVSPALRWRLLVLPLAALVTLADAAAPDMGISCLGPSPTGAGILASTRSFSQTFQSPDGGLSWQVLGNDAATVCPADNSSTGPFILTNLADGVKYRFTPGQGIDRSQDGGGTWHSIFTFAPLTEPDQTYVKLTLPGNLAFGDPPYAAMFDSTSGNLVVAMGLDGVLVRRASGDWTWVSVGPYRHDSLSQDGIAGLLALLFYQIFLAILVGLGWIFTRSASLMNAPRVWTILGWIGLAALSLLVVPDFVTSTYLATGTWIALAFMSIASLIALLVAIFNLKGRFFRMLPGGLLQAALLAAACLLPYALWGMHILPVYTYAFIASTILVLILFVVLSLGKLVKINPTV